jgi:hypothetical protein
MKKVVIIALLSIAISSCDYNPQQVSDSGVTKATTKVETTPDGTTIEQRNIIDRLKRDNEIGSIKHLYVISAYTGDVLQYSTVKGKVTSGGKRLSPKTVDAAAGIQGAAGNSNTVNINGTNYYTNEVLDDGGTYGESGNYLFWFDAQGNYQQYYPSGGTYLHISDRPLRIKKVNFSVELIADSAKKVN